MAMYERCVDRLCHSNQLLTSLTAGKSISNTSSARVFSCCSVTNLLDKVIKYDRYTKRVRFNWISVVLRDCMLCECVDLDVRTYAYVALSLPGVCPFTCVKELLFTSSKLRGEHGIEAVVSGGGCVGRISTTEKCNECCTQHLLQHPCFRVYN